MHTKNPTAWIPVARNVTRFLCLDAGGNVVCRHKNIRAASRCGKAVRYGALLKGGTVIPIYIVSVRASNGESALLPFPVDQKGLEAALEADRY